MKMEDKVKFLVDMNIDGNDTVFHKDSEYLILSEDKEHYYIQMVAKTNQVCKMPKKLEGDKFILVQI